MSPQQRLPALLLLTRAWAWAWAWSSVVLVWAAPSSSSSSSSPSPLYYSMDESPGLAQEFLAIQNDARAQVGEAPFQWSPQLARYAHWWAAQNAAYGDCGLHHSGGPYGENVFWGSAGKDWSPSDAVTQWADEKRWYSYLFNACALYDGCGHYTQMVWKDSRQVGCAKVTCADGNVFITCNYYPPGNYIGQRPY